MAAMKADSPISFLSQKNEGLVNVSFPERSGRRAVSCQAAEFAAYDMEGPVQPEMSWAPISYNPKSGCGTYLMRMQPGAVTIAHGHRGIEDFLILEGELIDDDGAVFKPGDFVSYDAGTRHNSRTVSGCLIAVFEWREPAPDRSTSESPK